MLFIFDLDHTLLDSSHRQLTAADGTLDLAHWKENCTREKILADKLLPLGLHYRLYRNSKNVRIPAERVHIACTARVMQSHDYDLLKFHGLKFDSILSRPETCTDGDVKLKDALLREFAKRRQIPFARLMATATFWDDNEAIREYFTKHGVTCYNPIPYNQAMGQKAYEN